MIGLISGAQLKKCNKKAILGRPPYGEVTIGEYFVLSLQIILRKGLFIT